MSAAFLLLFSFVVGEPPEPPPPTEADPESIATGGPQGRNMLLEFYLPGAANPYLVWPDVISADIEEAINLIGAFSVVVPVVGFGDSSAIFATHGREISIVYKDEGEVFRGIVEKLYAAGSGDTLTLQISGTSLIQELAYDNTYRGIIVDDLAVTAAFDLVLTDTDWTELITSAGVAFSRRYNNMSKYEALLDIAAIQGSYIRETDNLREVEIKNFSSDSGIILQNASHMTPEMAESTRFGWITDARRDSEGSNIWNRIVPEARSSRGYVDLGDSTRTTPYTIQSLIMNLPSITGKVDDEYTSVAGQTTQILGDINVVGDNRYLILYLMKNTNAFANTASPSIVYANGKAMTRIIEEGRGGPAAPDDTKDIEIWGIVGPDEGVNSIEMRWLTGATPVGGVNNYWMLISLQDVNQRTPYREADSADGASASPALAAFDSAVDDLVLGFMTVLGIDAAAITARGAGQTAFHDSPGIAVYVDEKAGAAPTTTLSWSLDTAVNWIVLGISLQPAIVYYIEDAASIAAYRRRVKILPLGDFKVTYALGYEFTANSIYDRTVDYLEEHKDPADFYSVDVAILPGAARDWFPGDSFLLDYRDFITGAYVIQNLICIKRNSSYDENGIRTWKLTLSTVARHREDIENAFYTVIQRINTIQNSQI